MSATPPASPVTVPFETEAIRSSELDQVNVRATCRPTTSRAVAVSTVALPESTRVGAGVTSTQPSGNSTSASTKTVNSNVLTVLSTSHSQVFTADMSLVSRISTYSWNGWFVFVKSPKPSGLFTAASPEPSVTLGPVWKKTRTPVTVVPSGVPSAWPMRFWTVTSAWKTSSTSS